MKISDPLPRQNDALRGAVSICQAKVLPAQNIDLVIQREEQKKLLTLLASSFLTVDEFAVIARRLDLDGQGCQSRRAIADELCMSLSAVLEYERAALTSIDQNFTSALAAYQQHFIQRKNQLHICD